MGFLLGYFLGKRSVRTDPKERLYVPPALPRTLKQTIGAPFVFLGQMLIGLVVVALLMAPVLFILSIGLMGLDIILEFLDHWATRHQYSMVQRFGFMGGLTGIYFFICYYVMAICRAACREYLQRHRERKKLKQLIKEAEAYANLV